MLDISPLTKLFLEVALVGFIAWLIMTYVPMEEPLRTIAKVVLVIAAVYFIFQLFSVIA